MAAWFLAADKFDWIKSEESVANRHATDYHRDRSIHIERAWLKNL